MKRAIHAIALITVLAMASSASASIVAGQIDTFQGGTVMSWGGGAIETNISTGGPAGAGDRYLQVVSDGGIGPGSRMATFNQNQWAGDYAGEGVVGIAMDVRNFGSTGDLNLRLMLLSSSGGTFTSTLDVVVANDGQWHNVFFGLTEADMTPVNDGFDYALTLGNVERLLLRHQPGAPAGQGDGAPPIEGIMGVDNIETILIPEPAALSLLTLGGLMLIRRRK